MGAAGLLTAPGFKKAEGADGGGGAPEGILAEGRTATAAGAMEAQGLLAEKVELHVHYSHRYGPAGKWATLPLPPLNPRMTRYMHGGYSGRRSRLQLQHFNSDAVAGLTTSHIARQKAELRWHGLCASHAARSTLPPHPFPNRARCRRAPWLRAFVLGANDGLVSTSSLMLGVSGGSESLSTIRLAGIAAWIAGALSMAVGE